MKHFRRGKVTLTILDEFGQKVVKIDREMDRNVKSDIDTLFQKLGFGKKGDK